MVNLFRKHQQFLLVVLTITIIIAFVWLYNTPQFERNRRGGGGGSVATIYGRSLGETDVQRHARRINLALQLGLHEFYQDLGGTMRGINMDTVFNSIVVQHEARELQVDATTDEVVEAVKGVEIFGTNGSFDPEKYSMFVQNALSPNGFTESQFTDLVRDSIRLSKLKVIVGSTVEVPAAEVAATLQQQYQKHEASTVTYNLSDFTGAIQISDEDVRRAYDQRKDNLKSEEKRSVELVKIVLTGDEVISAGKERTDALQKLADKASTFTQAMLAPRAKFADVAAKFGAKVEQTGEFTLNSPDPLLSDAGSAAQAAFKLTTQDPNSDAIQMEKGFCIMHLTQVIPSAQISLEQAKQGLVSQLKNERATEQIAAKAAVVRKSIEAAMKSGKSFADAAKAAGVAPVTVPAFSIAEVPEDGKVSRDVLAKIIETPAGRVSDFVPTREGGFLAFVEKRIPADEATLAKHHDYIATVLARARRELVFVEWLRQRRDEAKPETTPGA
jgi:peptidyl-prolyl cis-trans isomerase D